MVRNVTAHELKIKWIVNEQDAIDILTTISFLHKQVETYVLLSHKQPDSHIHLKVEFGEGEGKVPLDNIAKRAAAYKPKERV